MPKGKKNYRNVKSRSKSGLKLHELSRVVEQTADNIVITDKDGLIEYVNPAFVRLTGYTPQDVIGKTPRILKSGKHNDRFYDALWQTLLNGEPFRATFVNRKKNGSLYYEQQTITPLVDEKGNIIHFVSTGKDVSEQRRTEEKLEESERRFREMLENVELIAMTLDAKANITFCNDYLLRLTGWKREEVVGRSWFDRFIPPDASSVKDVFSSLLRNDAKARHHENEILTRSGDRRLIRWSNSILRDDSGSSIGAASIGEDITVQKAVYRIAEAANVTRSLDDLFRAVHEIVRSVMPADNFYIALYDENEDLLSFPYFVDEADLPSDPHKPGKGLTEYVLRTGEPLLCDTALYEEMIRRGDVELVGVPSPIWLGVPLRIEEKTIGVMAVQHYTDEKAYGEREKEMLVFVSSQVAKAVERKQAEEAILRQKAYFQELFDGANIGIAMLDTAGTILDMNKTFEDIFQYTKHELKGKKINDIIVPGRLSHEAEEFSQMALNRQKLEKETERRRKDGTTVDVLVNGFPITLNNETVGSYGIYVDITERRKLQRQLLRAQRMESIGTLAGAIAHDLNNVLGPIMMSVALLRKKVTDDQGRRMLDILETSASRGADLVKQVLMFGRGVEGERVQVQPRHLIGEIEKILKETFPKSIQLRMNLARNLWLVSGDSTQLHQILMNLSLNARDAMPHGGTLTIAAENILMDQQYASMHIEGKPGPYIMLTVTDTGTGIPPKILDKIFDPFFTTKEMGKGTGLGLSTVSSIVKSHGGFLSVYSELGKGSVFKIYLPALRTAEVSRTTAKEILLPSGNGEMILIVDDEASIREITKETLQTVGYRVVEAGDGAEALAVYAAKKQEISAVITDMMMPYLDGPTTIRALQKINPAVRIIAVSGRGDSQTLDKSAMSSVKELLNKPYTAETLLTTLQGVLHGGTAGTAL